MSDPATLGVYAARAQAYVDMAEEAAATDTAIDDFIQTCPPGGRVLDLGCGPGHFARSMAEAGLQAEGWDASPEMIAFAAAHPGVTARLASFDALTATDTYDGIWAYFSLLHAPRAAFPGHLRAIARALKPGGRLFLGMKTGDGGGPDSLGRHYEYYTPDALRALLRDAGLTPLRDWTGHGTGLAGTPEGWIVIEAHD